MSGIINVVSKILPKKIDLFFSLKIFFSDKGNAKIPIIIKTGILTASQIRMYVEGRSWAYIILPYVFVPTLLKWLALIFIVVIINEGSNKNIGLNRKVKKIKKNR